MRMRSKWRICATVLALAWMTGSACVPARGAPSLTLLLIVDGTKTFASTARVDALAEAIRAAGAFELSVCFTDQKELYSDPMTAAAERPAGTYDVAIILPHGLDDQTADKVWIVTAVLPWTSPDHWPALLASAYQTQGWLR